MLNANWGIWGVVGVVRGGGPCRCFPLLCFPLLFPSSLGASSPSSSSSSSYLLRSSYAEEWVGAGGRGPLCRWGNLL